MSNTVMSWWRPGFRADHGKISTPTLPATLDLTPRDKEEDRTGRGHTTGAREKPMDWLLSVKNLYIVWRREASWQSIRFDEKQFEQRTKWREFLIQIMACCPHALTAPGEMCLWSQDNYQHATDMCVSSASARRGFICKALSRKRPDLGYRVRDKLFRS